VSAGSLRTTLGTARRGAAARAEILFRRAYLALPLNGRHRWTVKRWGFRLTGWLMRGTASYTRWAATEARAAASPAGVAATAVSVAQMAHGLSLATSTTPDVSILIPVHGQVQESVRCLVSIARFPPRRPFEVIVVDDASPDETAEILGRVGGLRVISMGTNQGFIRACNFGARHARGSTLVFLNNDTEVTGHWCDELVDTFADRPDAGIVGAQLLYPDGRLQEAGGIIWRDGSGWNYGRGDDAGRPEYSYRRDVDYVSGAVLAVPRALFFRLGGFDERYLPAYGEDSDLAFKVRELGLAAIYQPCARVLHREGATGGADLSQGPKSFQVTNARKLEERWRPRLDETHHAPGTSVAVARERPCVLRVLVLDHCTPEADKDAGSITALNLMRLLQGLGARVTFIPEDNFLYLDRYTAAMQRVGIECLYAPYVTSVEDHLHEHGALYDVVVIFRFTAARRHLSAVRRWCTRAAVVLHTSDLHYLRLERQAALSGDHQLAEVAARTKAAELAVIGAVDATIVHSPVERDLLARDCSAAQVHVFEWAIDTPGTLVPFAARRDLVFLGGFQHPPNVDAALYLVNDILPLIRQRIPNVVLHLVGSNAPDEIRRLQSESVDVAGFVADLGPCLDQIRVAVAPLRYGAGIKGKVLTTMSHGLPNVLTTVAAEGLQLCDNVHALIADDPEAFADAVTRLYSDEDLWNRLARTGLETVASRFSLDAGKSAIAKILKGVRREPVVPPPVSSKAEWAHLADQQEWRRHLETTAAARARDTAIEDARVPAGRWTTFAVDGLCVVCHAPARFVVGSDYGLVAPDGRHVPNWREHLVCECGLNARTRAVIHAIEDVVAFTPDADVFVMEHGSPLHRHLAARYPRMIAGAFLGNDVDSGTTVGGIRHEDATRLSFADTSLDLIVSCDVLEHIHDYPNALAECARSLRPGGTLLLTVPFVLNSATTIVRARVRHDGSIEHVLAPEYHGDPRQPEGILCFQHFGWDLLPLLRHAGFRHAELVELRSLRFGYPADGIVLVRALK
jgi:GT2 family glycosyltransferase